MLERVRDEPELCRLHRLCLAGKSVLEQINITNTYLKSYLAIMQRDRPTVQICPGNVLFESSIVQTMITDWLGLWKKT